MSIRHLLSLMLFSAFMIEAEAQPVVADSAGHDSIAAGSRQNLPKRLDQKLTKMYFNSKSAPHYY